MHRYLHMHISCIVIWRYIGAPPRLLAKIPRDYSQKSVVFFTDSTESNKVSSTQSRWNENNCTYSQYTNDVNAIALILLPWQKNSKKTHKIPLFCKTFSNTNYRNDIINSLVPNSFNSYFFMQNPEEMCLLHDEKCMLYFLKHKITTVSTCFRSPGQYFSLPYLLVVVAVDISHHENGNTKATIFWKIWHLPHKHYILQLPNANV